MIVVSITLLDANSGSSIVLTYKDNAGEIGSVNVQIPSIDANGIIAGGDLANALVLLSGQVSYIA